MPTARHARGEERETKAISGRDAGNRSGWSNPPDWCRRQAWRAHGPTPVSLGGMVHRSASITPACARPASAHSRSSGGMVRRSPVTSPRPSEAGSFSGRSSGAPGRGPQWTPRAPSPLPDTCSPSRRAMVEPLWGFVTDVHGEHISAGRLPRQIRGTLIHVRQSVGHPAGVANRVRQRGPHVDGRPLEVQCGPRPPRTVAPARQSPPGRGLCPPHRIHGQQACHKIGPAETPTHVGPPRGSWTAIRWVAAVGAGTTRVGAAMPPFRAPVWVPGLHRMTQQLQRPGGALGVG